MFAFDKGMRIPENIQAYMQDSFSKARDSYEKATVYTKGNMQALEEAVVATQANAKKFGEQVLRNAEANTEAAFEAAHALARAKTLPELARLQSDFLQQQIAATSAQSKELFELSTKITHQTFATLSSAVSKSFEHLNEQLKKVG
jgi:hypothetical protein